MEAAEKVVAGEFARFDIGQTTNEELLRAQDLLAVTSRNFMRAVVDYKYRLGRTHTGPGDLSPWGFDRGSPTITLLTEDLRPSYKIPMSQNHGDA